MDPDLVSSPSVGGVAVDLLPALKRHLDRDLRFVLVRAGVTHLGEGGQRPSDVAAALGTAFDQAATPGDLGATIAEFVQRGIDAERITWEVISRESVRHEGLIHKECNRLVRALPERDPDELTGYGWAGLRTALRNFDPELGYAFSTYACPKINGAIRDGVRAESPIPKRLTTFRRKVTAAEEKLTHELARQPTYAEIAAYVSSTESLHLLPRLAPQASLEELSVGMDVEYTREPACLVDVADPQAEALVALRDAALHAALDALDPDDAQAVRVLVLDEVPIGVAATQLGVEARQLRQRKARGLKSLEDAMRAWVEESELVCA